MLPYKVTEPRVLALLVQLKKHVGLIPLADELAFELCQLTASADQLANIRLGDLPSGESPSRAIQPPVQSITVIYGENGGGKTHSMIEACRSLSNLKGVRDVALIWESQGQKYLDPGSRFKRRLTVTYNGNDVPVKRIARPIKSIFYTTSPFESIKRRDLKSEDFFDVTPAFSARNPFEGGALLRAYSKLPKDLPFIDRADVIVRFRNLSLQTQIEKVIASGKSGESKLGNLEMPQRRALTRLSKILDSKASSALALELLISLDSGAFDAEDTLLRILEMVHPYHDLSNDLSMNTIERISGDVLAFVYERSASLRREDNAIELRYFLEEDLRSRTAGKRSTLGELANLLSDLREEEWNMLHRATELGLVSWSFRNLSSGEVALLMLMSSISSALAKLSRGQTAFLFIDEGEMFMHPAWQRRYIADLLNFLQKFPELARSIHVVLATHSLIVAADAPPNRLFDVETGKMTNGFGYGPKDLLDRIYGVDHFQGEHSGHLMSHVVEHIKDRKNSTVTTDDAISLAMGIADDRLKNYLVSALVRQREMGGDQA